MVASYFESSVSNISYAVSVTWATFVRRRTSTRGNVDTCLYRFHVLFAQKWIYFPFLSLNTLELINCTVYVLHEDGGKQICRLNHINHILQFPRISYADNSRRFLMICNLFSKLEAFQIFWGHFLPLTVLRFNKKSENVTYRIAKNTIVMLMGFVSSWVVSANVKNSIKIYFRI